METENEFLKMRVLKIVSSTVINVLGLTFSIFGMLFYLIDKPDIFFMLIGAFFFLLNILLNPYRMKVIDKEVINKMAETLADPKVTVEDLKLYKEKAKVMIETIEMAQDAEDKQLNKMVKNIVGGRIG